MGASRAPIVEAPFNGFGNDVARIWTGANGAGARTCLFRRAFDIPVSARSCTLHLFAESRYHVWLNDEYLGRGPAFHHPTELLVDTYGLLKCDGVKDGRNVLAVLVQSLDVSFHNHVPTGEPGLVATIEIVSSAGEAITIPTDSEWKMTGQTGWRTDSPRRCWAIDYLEEFEMAVAPTGWRAIDFDDGDWGKPESFRPATTVPGGRFLSRPLPALAHGHQYPTKFLGLFSIREPASPERRFSSSGELGKSIMLAEWKRREPADVPAGGTTFSVDGLSSTEGAVVCFDLGAEFVGQVVLECDCPGPGTIDVGWSEVAENGRPLIVRKGVGYVDRIHAVKGRLKWSPIQFSAMRYLVLVLRGFNAPVRVERFGVRASEPDVGWTGTFQSNDDRLNDVFAMCARSLRVGTQETQMDCPSREQAAYIGDGMLTGRWFAQLTGDVRHWRYLIHEQFRRQSSSGILRAAIFSGRNDTCIDYTLFAVIGLRDYVTFSDDTDSARELIDNARMAFAFFDRYRANHGLCTWTFDRNQSIASWENVYDPAQPVFGESDGLVLIIDHPGMGWHNKNEAGIDRRGTNAALNALIVIAKRALADLEDIVGERSNARALREDAERLADLIGKTFFDPARSVFVDGVLDGERLKQISEQTNTLAIAARCCDDDTARGILSSLLTNPDDKIARNGPYFWAYLFPELLRLGLHELGARCTRARWGKMLDGGASTLWETFLGDDLDSWCHPWAAAPVDFLSAGILGLPLISDGMEIVLRPRFDLLSSASGSAFTNQGWISISWSRVGNAFEIRGTLPNGVEAAVLSPTGRSIAKARGEWATTIAV